MPDLRQGILWREWARRDPSGRVTRVRSFRLASLADRRRVALRDFGLLLGALTLARLAWSYDTPPKRDRS